MSNPLSGAPWGEAVPTWQAVVVAAVIFASIAALLFIGNKHDSPAERQSAALERIAAALEAVPPVCEITGLAGPMADTLSKAATPRGK